MAAKVACSGVFFKKNATVSGDLPYCYSMNVFSIRFFLLPAAVFVCFTGVIRADDWPHFLGPNQNFHSAETGLNLEYSEEEGPKVLWEVERGKGHAGPVIVDGKLVFIHQVEKQEEIRCLNAETGEDIWKHACNVEVAQSYGITDQPRSSPVIDPETKYVYTLGNDGDLLCLQLDDGKVVWKMRLEEKIRVVTLFLRIWIQSAGVWREADCSGRLGRALRCRLEQERRLCDLDEQSRVERELCFSGDW